MGRRSSSRYNGNEYSNNEELPARGPGTHFFTCIKQLVKRVIRHNDLSSAFAAFKTTKVLVN
jgi:hypothetical protein